MNERLIADLLAAYRSCPVDADQLRRHRIVLADALEEAGDVRADVVRGLEVIADDGTAAKEGLRTDHYWVNPKFDDFNKRPFYSHNKAWMTHDGAEEGIRVDVFDLFPEVNPVAPFGTFGTFDMSKVSQGRNACTTFGIAGEEIDAGMMVSVDGSGRFRQVRYGDTILGICLSRTGMGRTCAVQYAGSISFGHGEVPVTELYSHR